MQRVTASLCLLLASNVFATDSSFPARTDADAQPGSAG